MITRKQAETQAERCLEYHAVLAAGITGIVAIVDRRLVPWFAAGLGAGVAIHAACLLAIPSTRECILRSTASLMEDLQHQKLETSQRSSQMAMASHQ